MQCPVCGHDRLLIIANAERFAEFDLRKVMCQSCQRVMLTRTVIVGISVVHPETLQSEDIPPEKFSDQYRKHCLGQAPHPAWEGRIDG